MLFRLILLLLLVAAFPARAGEDVAIAEYDYLKAAAATQGDVLSDYALADRLRTIIKFSNLPSAVEKSESRKAALLELSDALAVLDARVDKTMLDNAALLVLRLGPMPRPMDTAQQKSVWARRLIHMDSGNAFSLLTVLNYAFKNEDYEVAQVAVHFSMKVSAYDDYRKAIMASAHSRYKNIPADIGAEYQSRYDNAALSVAVMSTFDPLFYLGDMGEFCKSNEEPRRKFCKPLYKAMMANATDPVTLGNATRVLESIGDQQEVQSAKTIQRDSDWIATEFGMLLLNGQVTLDEAYLRKLMSDGQLAATKAVLTAKGIALTPPEGWARP